MIRNRFRKEVSRRDPSNTLPSDKYVATCNALPHAKALPRGKERTGGHSFKILCFPVGANTFGGLTPTTQSMEGSPLPQEFVSLRGAKSVTGTTTIKDGFSISQSHTCTVAIHRVSTLFQRTSTVALCFTKRLIASGDLRRPQAASTAKDVETARYTNPQWGD
jgi:hypothetical protein